MPNPDKIERVAALKARIEASDALLLTEYRGLTVSEITELRQSLAEGGASFAVVKNTLMRRAVVDAGLAELEVMLTGPSAVTFIEGDAVAAAKSVVKAQKQFPALVLKGGLLDGKMLTADEAKALAELESREVMLSQLAGMMKGEMSRAAAMFQAGQSKFLSLLGAYREKVPGDEPALDDETPQATEAEPESAAQPEPSDAEPTEQAESEAIPDTIIDDIGEAEASDDEEERE